RIAKRLGCLRINWRSRRRQRRRRDRRRILVLPLSAGGGPDTRAGSGTGACPGTCAHGLRRLLRMITSSSWRALGTTASVSVTDAAAIVGARNLLEAELDRIDRACSRFRSDSELMRVNQAAGKPVAVNAPLME